MVELDPLEFNNFNLLDIILYSKKYKFLKSGKYSILIAAGGGGGGAASYLNEDVHFGSGGGAGGVIFLKDLKIGKNDSYPILIGSGGLGGRLNNKGSQGGNTIFGNYIAIAGGGGGSGTSFDGRHIGSSGGSGGGSSLSGNPGNGIGRCGKNGGSSTNHGGAGGGGYCSAPNLIDDNEYIGQYGGRGILIPLLSSKRICDGGNGGGQIGKLDEKHSGGRGGDYLGYSFIDGEDAKLGTASGGGGGSASFSTLKVGMGGNGGSGFCAIFSRK
jgi:hypothetical protein